MIIIIFLTQIAIKVTNIWLLIFRCRVLESREINRRSYNSSLPQRRAVHYQSTGSLHSDSQSSSSVSPIPSPSPRATPLPAAARKTPTVLATTNNSVSSLHKRWSSTGDFNHTNSLTSPQSKWANDYLFFSFFNFLNFRIKSTNLMKLIWNWTNNVAICSFLS